jgi:uncharacterized protein (UPF0261 family)
VKPVYVIGTCDTKDAELRYAARCITQAGAAVVLVDISTGSSRAQADVTPAMVASHHPDGAAAVLGQSDRGLAVSAMAKALSSYLATRHDIGAVLGLGGGGNTAMVTAAMRTLPIGVPKLMVSTMASGNVAPYVGPTDIMMMYTVADIAGMNTITRAVIGNAANAAAGMALNAAPVTSSEKPAVGLTMFGVTTPAVTELRRLIGDSWECFVFHATGTGGQCMEKLVDSGLLAAIVDLTTTEIADHLFGGVLPCTDDRLGAVIRKGIPWLGSVGAVDMINFGAPDTVPERHAGRKLHSHNPQVTLMRTTEAENSAIGSWLVARINQMTGPASLLLPLRGVSALDAPGEPFHDPAADQALFAAIRSNWHAKPNHRLLEIDAHINDATFAEACAKEFQAMTTGA